jgi:hypothetical protein
MAASAFAAANRSPIIQPLSGQISQVGAGQVALLKIPQGATYASISLACGIGGQLTPLGAGTAPSRANLEAFLTLWRLQVSGVEVWALTGTQLIAIMEYYMPGLIGDTGIVTIAFQRLWMKDVVGMLAPDYGTLGESSFQLLITQDASSTITNIDVWAEVEPAAEPLGSHIEYSALSENFVSGRQQFSLLSKDPSWVMYNLFIQVPDVTKVQRLELYADNIPVWDAPPFLGNALGREGTPQRVPQAGFVNMDFCRRGLDTDPLPLNMATLVLWLTFTTSPGATAINMIQELGKPSLR